MDYQFLRDMKNDPRRLHQVTVDPQKCMGCKRCLKACAYDVYKWNEEKHVSEDIFARGVCLPSDTKMTTEEQQEVIRIIKELF